MFDNMYSRLNLAPRTPTWFLDYEKCTTAELRRFFEDRTGTTLNEGQLQKVRDHGSYPLIDGLRQMDREATFPRFMELAPELRLGVYEALLTAVEKRNRHKGEPALHPSVLRTSKKVYSEAMPVLYKENNFYAKLWYATRPSRSLRSVVIPVCSLTISRPGGGHHLNHSTTTGHVAIVRALFEQSFATHMLRMLTHLAIDIELVTPWGNLRDEEYSIMARATMKALCLSMSGASRLKELTIRVSPGDQEKSNVDLANLLWPLLLLREDVTIKFEGITTDAEEALTEGKKGLKVGAAFARQIALVKQIYNSELERPGWEDRRWEFHGIREAEKLLYALQSPGKRNLCLDDIVNMSPVWKRLRREIDCVEASNSEQ